jgi:outer membrane cobalamin receptor
MMNIIFSLFLISGITGKIQGTVKNEDTGEPVPFASVRVLNTEIGSAADDQGNFYILNVPSGVYAVEVSSIGYQIKTIERVVVEIDQTVRLKITLRPATIDLAPVTVVSETPTVKKDMVATTYYIRKQEITNLPFDYISNVVNIQPSVAHIDTAVHVRGGRADEVLYLIDNISIADPQNGDLAVSMSKGLVDEVIFLPGNFDAEYGRAMSGVVNLITALPADRLQGTISAKTEKIMPFYYDFGYQTYQALLHLPAAKNYRGFISFDGMHTDDWDPRLYIQPHKQRDDYSLYGKLRIGVAPELKLTLSGIKSRSQFDRYQRDWKFWLDHYRSDMRNGNLEALNINYLPAPRYFFNVTLSHLFTEKIYGMRDEDAPTGFLRDFRFHDYRTLRWPTPGFNNPFGVSYRYFYCAGDFPEFQDKRSRIIKGAATSNLQLQHNHELKAGVDYSYLDLTNFTSYISDSLHQVFDDYGFKPREASGYIQDNIDYEGLYAKVGLRGDYFSPGIDTLEPKITVSPRIGFSFMVTDKFLFRANIGQYTQPPLYDQLYSGLKLMPIPSFLTNIPLIGNPDLRPEKTKSYEIGLQGEVRPDMSVTFNAFSKEISDLIGTRYVNALPRGYVEYQNVEYANVRGFETILEFGSRVFTGKISYTLSWARGTSSYASEVYYRYYQGLDTLTLDTSFVPPAQEYNLDFDQRNRIFVQGVFNIPSEIKLYLFGYFGDGFPYTPPGPEGKLVERNIKTLPFQEELDCVVSKAVKVRGLSFNVSVELLNLLDERYQIADIYPAIPEEDIKPWDFDGNFLPIGNPYYQPAADHNHDGLVVPQEYYESFLAINRASEDWVSAYSAPRRARVSVTFNF